MLTKKYEVCLLDRNKFDAILHKAISSVSPTPTVEIDYGRKDYFEELNGYSIRNVMHICFKYKLPNVITDIIIRKLKEGLKECEYVRDITVGYSQATGDTTILIVFDCEVFDSSYNW